MKRLAMAIALVALLLIANMTVAPSSVTATISNKKEVDPQRPIPVITRGLGVTATVSIMENGRKIPAGQYTSGVRNPRTPLKYDTRYLVLVRARNWIGQTVTTKRTVRTWTTPKVARFVVETSTGSMKESPLPPDSQRRQAE